MVVTAVMVLLVLAPAAARAQQQQRIVKIVLPVPTVNVPHIDGWQRTGTLIRNLYPQVDPVKGLQTDAGADLSVTLTIKTSAVVFADNGLKTLTVKIPAGKASATFRLAVAAGGTWLAGERPEIDGAPAGGSGYTGAVQMAANVRAAQVLAQFDIDGDGLPDGAPDSDGDGLPDNWEQGGYKTWLATQEESGADDRLVKYSAPTAISPGTPPVFVLNRQAVTTSAGNWDSDGDGLSDFVEVFGLKYIDRNGNGLLENGNEWNDLSGDGMPSTGENPVRKADPSRNLNDNFAGFMFTDPSSGDMDGDELLDGEDPEPLINPKTFGVDRGNFQRVSSGGKADLDNDGLGNGSDFGNDLTGQADSPEDLSSLIRIFRKDLYNDGSPRIPESLIEDLIGADWDGNGLYRTTDVRNFRVDATAADLQARFGSRFQELFYVGSQPLFSDAQVAAFKTHLAALAQTRQDAGSAIPPTAYGQTHLGLGVQDLLLPDQRTSGGFFPDIRVWTVLYAWRVPGFDIDGNGYVGSPAANFANDDVHVVPTGNRLDGQIVAPDWATNLVSVCGLGSGAGAVLTVLSLAALKVTVAPRMRRPRG